MRVCPCVRETRPPEENKERRTVETSKFRRRPPTRMVSPTAAPQNFFASSLPQELKITTVIPSRQSAACSKNSGYFLYFLCVTSCCLSWRNQSRPSCVASRRPLHPDVFLPSLPMCSSAPMSPEDPSKILDPGLPLPPRVCLKVVKSTRNPKIQLDQVLLKSTTSGRYKRRLRRYHQRLTKWPGLYWYLSSCPTSSACSLLRRQPWLRTVT